MAKNIYIGVLGVARKVKTPNIGVSGVARKGKAGYIGVAGVARQFYQPLEVGHYWLIEPNSIKEYNASGTLLNTTNGAVSSWTCPASGAYYVELHGEGGDGARGFRVRDYQWILLGGGGGGGGSGAYANISNLPTGTYTISWKSGASITGNGLSNNYYVENGRPGIEAVQNDYAGAEVIPGRGGDYGECGSEMTNMAKKGSTGPSKVLREGNSESISGGAGGSGGSTIGNYGDGGRGGGVQNGAEDYGDAGQGAAIIIKKI